MKKNRDENGPIASVSIAAIFIRYLVEILTSMLIYHSKSRLTVNLKMEPLFII